MKKIFAIACLLFIGNLQAQKISKKEAQKLLEKTIACLKSGDTTSFANLWNFDNTGRPYDKTVFTRQNAIQEFYELKMFLDTALVKSIPFDNVEVEDFKSWSKYKVKYKIKAWFKYDDGRRYYKGFGVLVDFIDNEWAFRFTFEQSTQFRE